MKKIKSQNQILIMLAFFSISVGLWGNFRQLWLESNNFSVLQISNLISLGTFVSIIGIMLIGKYIKIDKLKKYIIIAQIIKFFNLIVLYYLNEKELNNIIRISIIIDIVMEYIIITSIYPLITNIIKNNNEYSKRQLTEYLFRDVGILIGGIFIGRYILGIFVDYNICLIISNLFLLFSIISILKINNDISQQITTDKEESILKYITRRKILVLYLIYMLIGTIAMSTALGLKMLTLTNYFNFSDSLATNYLLIVGLIADTIGIIALKYLTPKNDYLTLTIKFGIRFLGYVIAFFSSSITFTLIAITWSILISTAYENICDGPYVNSVANEYQLEFTNMRYIVRFLGEAIGVFLCGLMYENGLKYMFGLSAVFIVFQLGISYYMIYLRKHTIRIICNKNPQIKYTERKCAYAIIYDDQDNIAIANDGKYFFFGGGTEENETALQTLKREILEETGYTLKEVFPLESLISYEYNSSRGNLKIVATIYTAKFDKKITEPIEKDHQILWGKPEKFIDIMYHKYQRVILKEYSEKHKMKGETIC